MSSTSDDGPRQIFEKYTLEAMGKRAARELDGREEVRFHAVFFAGFNGVPGDFLEFGSFRGDGIVQAYHTHRALQEITRTNNRLMVWEELRARDEYKRREAEFSKMRFVAFDSFDGLPAPTEEYEHGLLDAGDVRCSLEEFEENMRINQVDRNRVEVVPGFFDETLVARTKTRLGLRAASVVYVDCDLYESARLALDFVTDLVVDGTIIVFDDWYLFKGHPDRGEQKAFNEWLEKNQSIQVSEFIRNGSLSSFIVHL